MIANASSIHTWRWIDPLLTEGHDISVFTYKKPLFRPSPNVKVHDLTQLPKLPTLRWLMWGIWLRAVLQKINPDILHAHQIQAAGWLGVMAGFHPFVVSSWGSDLLIEPQKSMLRRFLVKKVLSGCDCLTVPSQRLLQSALALGIPSEKLRLIPWGVDTLVFTPSPHERIFFRSELELSTGGPVVFCPRAVTELYNIDIVIQACQGLSHQYPGLQLILLQYNMDQDYRNKLEEQITRDTHPLVIHWLPAQQHPQEMAKLYNTVDATISLPSSEGYGASVFEALACGCPTVITDLPVFRSDLKHGEHLLKVPVRDVASTQQSLARILSDSSLREHLIANSLEWTKSHTIQSRLEKTEALYRDLTKKK